MAYGSYAHIQKLNGFEIPDRWDCRKLKFCSTCNDEIHPESMDPDTEIFYVDISSVNLSEGVIQIEAMPFEKAPSRARRRTQSGDTIVSTVRTYLKAIAYIDDRNDLTVSTGFAVLRPNQVLDSKYLSYYARSELFVGEVTSLSNGVSYPAINPITLVGIPALFPNCKKEQAQIARFLDYKTAQLDQLIAKKQALIERLNEQRIALITQAVTRGLNPDVPLKDSGVEWLGQVPEGWEVAKLRRCVSTVTSGSRGWAKYFSDSGDIFLRITNLTRNSIQLMRTDIQRVMPPEGSEGERTKTQPGDVLISITADLGSVAVIPDSFEAAYVSQHICLVRPERDKVLPEWLAMSVFSHSGRAQLGSSGYGGTKQQLSLADVKELVFTMPPTLKEQGDILEYVQVETEKTDRLVSLTVDTINRLEEYRTALITAAVTGKIDVRDIQIPVPPNDGPTSENIHEKASSQA